MHHGDKRHVRLLAKGETQGHGAMRRQVANERVRQRLAAFLRFLILGISLGDVVLIAVAVFDDLAITIDAHPVDDGFAVPGCFRLRCFILGPDETALDAGFAVMGQDNEHAAARDLLRLVGMTQRIDPLDLRFKLPAVHVVGQFVMAVIFRCQAVKFVLRDVVSGGVFCRKLHRMRIGTAHAVRVGKVDMDGNPLPALGLLNLRRDPFELFDDKPVQQGGSS